MAITYDNKNDYIVVAVKSVEGGKVSGGNVSILKGESITLTATPDENYEFLGWEVSEGYSSSENPYTFTPSGNVSVVPKFKTIGGTGYTITWKCNGNTKVYLDTTLQDSYNYGDKVNLHFKLSGNWTDPSRMIGGIINDLTNNTSEEYLLGYYFQDGYIPVTVTGNMFISVLVGDDVKTAINTKSNYDDIVITVIPSEVYPYQIFSAAIYNPKGRKITSITYETKTGYVMHTFDNSASVINYTYDQGDRYIAVVADELSTDTYNITVSTDGNGDVSLPHENPYNDGEWVVLRATPAAGYEFESYEIDGEIITSINYVFQIHADINVKVTFKKNTEVASTISVIADPVEGGKPTVNGVLGSRELNKGTKCTIAGKANSGYSVIGYYDGDTLLGTGNEYSFTVGDDKTITVKYKKLPVDPYSPGGDSGTGGGDGSFDDTSDPTPEPSATNAIADGLVGLYRVDTDQIKVLSGEMFDPTVWETVKQFFDKPTDCLVWAGTLPFSQGTSTETAIKAGGYTFKATGHSVVKDVITLNIGTVLIPKYWNSMLDYAPYTDVNIYLPFCGTFKLDTTEVIGKFINIKYRVNLITGDCIACIYIPDGSNETLRYQFNGNVLNQYPLSARDSTLAQALSGVIATAGGIVGVASGAGAGLGAGAITSGVGSMIGAFRDTYERSGSITASKGYIAPRYPIIYISRPKQNIPSRYGTDKGYPSNITAKLGDLSGYTEVDESIHIDEIDALDNEVKEIHDLLVGGVIIN